MKKTSMYSMFLLGLCFLFSSFAFGYELPTNWSIKFNNVEQVFLPNINWDSTGDPVQNFDVGDGIEDNWGIAQITSIIDRGGSSQTVVWSDGDDGEHLSIIFWGLDVYKITAIDENLNGLPDKFKVRLRAATESPEGFSVPDLDGDGDSDGGMSIWLDNDTSGSYTPYNIISGPASRTSATAYPGITDGIKQGDFVFKPGVIATDESALTQVDQDSITDALTGDGTGYLDAIQGSGPFADSVNTNGFVTAWGDRDVFLLFDLREHPDPGLPDYGWVVNSEDPAFGTKSEEEEPIECRMTGGGVTEDGEILLPVLDNQGFPVEGTVAEANNTGDPDLDRYQFGGQVGAPTASQPQPSGEWTHHQQIGPMGKFTFHAGTASAPEGTEIDLVICSDPDSCIPARPAPAKRIYFEGVGTFKNVQSGPLKGVVVPDKNKVQRTLHWFRALVEDIGEPKPTGQQPNTLNCTHVIGTPILPDDCVTCPDVYQIQIYADESPEQDEQPIYTVGGFINHGNLQIHPPIK